MKKVLLYIWQLPQHLVALMLISIYTLIFGKPEKQLYKDKTYYWFSRFTSGVSLGDYVILGTYYKKKPLVINHEWGHTEQSKLSGPFYLLFIGIPSVTGNIISRIFKCSSKWYYSLPWEKGADIFGGVKRDVDKTK